MNNMIVRTLVAGAVSLGLSAQANAAHHSANLQKAKELRVSAMAMNKQASALENKIRCGNGNVHQMRAQAKQLRHKAMTLAQMSNRMMRSNFGHQHRKQPVRRPAQVVQHRVAYQQPNQQQVAQQRAAQQRAAQQRAAAQQRLAQQRAAQQKAAQQRAAAQQRLAQQRAAQQRAAQQQAAQQRAAAQQRLAQQRAAQQRAQQQVVYQQPVQQQVVRRVVQQPVQQQVIRRVVQQPVQQQVVRRVVYQQPVQRVVYQQPVQQPVAYRPAPQPVRYVQPNNNGSNLVRNLVAPVLLGLAVHHINRRADKRRVVRRAVRQQPNVRYVNRHNANRHNVGVPQVRHYRNAHNAMQRSYHYNSHGNRHNLSHW